MTSVEQSVWIVNLVFHDLQITQTTTYHQRVCNISFWIQGMKQHYTGHCAVDKIITWL